MGRWVVLMGLLLSGCAKVTGALSTDLLDGVPREGRRVFFTLAGGAAGGFAATTGSIDGPCLLARNAAGLKRNYIAILSTSTVNARDRVTGSQPIYKVTGDQPVLIADNANQLWTGTTRLYAPIDTNENGVLQDTPISLRAWTGSNSAGVFESLRSCDDWTDSGYPTTPAIGSHTDTDSRWIRSGTSTSCNPSAGSRGIFCISI